MFHDRRRLGAIRTLFAAIGVPATWTATDNPLVDNGGGASVTFTSVSLGLTATDRLTTILVNTHTTVATSVTVGGLSATKAVEESTTISGLQIWYVDTHTLGTTANIVVSAGGTLDFVVIQTGRLTGVTFTPTATPPGVNNGLNDPSTITATVPTGGFGIVGLSTSVTVTGAWSNATQDFNTTPAATGAQQSVVSAHTSSAGSQTPSYTGLGGGTSHMVMACWGP